MKPNQQRSENQINNTNINPDNQQQTKPINQQPKSQLSGVRRYKKGRSFADTLFGKMRYGKDLVTQKWVAIKENRKWFAQNRVSIKGDPVPEDLFKEIDMMKYLMKQPDLSPNILKLLDVVQDDVYIYLVLELIDGGDFFGFIHNNHQKMESLKQLNLNANNNESKNDNMDQDNISIEMIENWEFRMKKVFYQIVSAIKWLHFKNVCHMDISLENALIDNNDTIRIIDFGLAKFCSNGEFVMEAKRIGKPRCMSPEVFNIQSFDGRLSDSWSVGIMLFMMLLGIPPWNFPSESETIYRMIKAGRIRDVIVYNNKKNMMSNHALDLLVRFLKPQNERIYLDQVLKHPFCYF